MKLRLQFLFPLALLVVGCSPKDPATNTVGGKTPATPTASNSDSTPKALDRSQIPAELKTEAYEYFGLDNDKPVDMQVVVSSDPGVKTGTVTTTLSEIKDGKAIFTIDRTGGLMQLGTQKVTLQKDGIYVTESTDAVLESPQMELSSNLQPGSTWNSKLKVDKPGSNMELTTTYTVKGVQKFTTKKGPREGLLVVAKGSGTANGDPITFESSEWYVKGVGGVKAVLVTKTKSGKGQTITIEESK
ncbi:MAG: hypothetical protein ACAH95_18330 [Fimbriimonas sp.]